MRKPVTLFDVLDAREQRQREQQRLLKQYSSTLVCFTMNIAGACKRSPLIDFAFDRGRKALCGAVPQSFSETIRRDAGNEFYLVSPLSAAEVKAICVRLEETGIGRLYDMDVLTPVGEKLSRSVGRTCLVCGGSAFACARSRAHGIDAVTKKTQQLLHAFAAEELADLAVQALRGEVRLTPKPGLVDENNPGAHRDMDLELFLKSAEALRPYFRFCAARAMEAPDCMPDLQKAGLEAERTMLHATGGVNTHKGAIYSLGILTAAAGASLAHERPLFEQAAAYARAGKRSDAGTHGNTALARYGGRGAREEAEQGFPLARKACRLLRMGLPAEEVLLHLILECQDTNLLHRGGAEGLEFTRMWARKVLSAEPAKREARLLDMDAALIGRNLSPGGCADILAQGIFLQSLSIV